MAISTTTVATPEYLAFRECYEQVIRVAKIDPGSLCDALFSRGYIPESVRDYTRTDSLPDENKARKLIDNVIDHIRDDPKVFHKFINILTPEYLAFRTCYEQVIRVAKIDPGSLCDALFSRGYIPESVRDYTRTDSLPDENKARKLIDNVIDHIRDDPKVFHEFINILESQHYDNLKKRLIETYSFQAKEPCQSEVLEKSIATVNTEHTSQPTTNTFVCPYCSKCSLEQYLSDEGCPEASGKTLFPYLDKTGLSEEDRLVLENTLVSETNDLKTLFAHTDTYIAQNLYVSVTKVKNFALDLVRDLEQEENEAKIETATTIPEIILALQPYNSYLNYEIIESIVTEFGSPETLAEMQKYVKAFNNFCKRSAFELPINALPKQVSKSNQKILSVKLAKKGLVLLRDAVTVRQILASIFGVKKWVLNLCSIEGGCVCVRFLVPAAVTNKILPLSPTVKSALRDADILTISIEEEQATYDAR